ncbi:hypothetical protein ETAA8_69720 [Anatilimnocola aggregata]|uniref:Acetyl xylan esterase domain-containing protein n=1 Tax=Anatilimnocola aggregata TaxID=2528021 RepID=A0A517YNK7_9BACT|nr:acetylxylan esterase [Anatilimnocola aggregata]QDU31812.1 hypothetical protein ETAA8_69720 [Anatilimnocola aggregata]
MLASTFRLLLFTALLAISVTSFADEANRQSLTETLSKFTAPDMPDEVKQKLRDYVPNDLRQRREAANAKSSADWHAIKSREEWEAFRREKLKLLRKSLGRSFAKDDWQPPSKYAPLEKAGEIKGDGYRIEKLLYTSAYGQWITANLYAPEPPREKMPGFIVSHAHHTPKENGELQDMGVLWARAGCYVLVPDHLGHGERKQHPFRSAADYAKPFQVSRQDYYHRYDLNLQLNIIGESLMGCLALDLMSGVSLLRDLPGIDREKIILLGAVAGGGDPAAVAAALDERISCAAPFNFGGPQPESKYPLPEDAETSFNYGGSGGWESTRNLASSLKDGTLPWVIVGSIAPRRLIYGHEFAWDRERDPVWRRFEKIYGWYDKPDQLSFATGYGTITAKDPPGSHCTHIGKTHRKQIHEALAKWFEIKLPNGEESTDRHDSAELRCCTDELHAKLQPVPLLVPLQAQWKKMALSAPSEFEDSPNPTVDWQSGEMLINGLKGRQIVLRAQPNRLIPLLVLEPPSAPAKNKPGVLVINRGLKQDFIRQRAALIAQLLDAGVSVALPDLYNSGLTGSGTDTGRRSGNTSRSSTLAMFGNHLRDEQLQDALSTFGDLSTRQGWDPDRVAVWSDSLIPPNPDDTNFQVPRDDDGRLPPGPDPLPHMVAQAMVEMDLPAIYTRGNIDSLETALRNQLVLLPHDAVPLPLMVRTDVATESPQLRLRQDQLVDCWNRAVPTSVRPGEDNDPRTAAAWLIEKLRAKKSPSR